MHGSLPNDGTSSRGRKVLVAASAVAVAALVGSVYFAVPQSSVQAQQGPGAGRAPLSFADVVERVKPAVVSINVSSPGPKVAKNEPKGRGDPNDKFNKGDRGGGRDTLPELPDDHPLNDFFRNMPKDFRAPRPTQAQGSGFVISADGYVVTNNHVIDGAGTIQVSFDRDNKYEADLIGTDQRTDLALLKIKANGKTFPFVKFSSTTPRVGDWVIAVGNPFGLGGTVTAGIVSAQGRDIGSGPYDYMQIDAAVNKGNSGGPTFNLDGEVVGVNTAIYSPSGGNVGIAFAIPSKTATEVMDQLKSSRLGEARLAGRQDPECRRGRGCEPRAPGSQGRAGQRRQRSGSGGRCRHQERRHDPGRQRQQDTRQPRSCPPDRQLLSRHQGGGEGPACSARADDLGQARYACRPTRSWPRPVLRVGRRRLRRWRSSACRSRRAGKACSITDVDPGSDAGQKGIRVGDLILEIGGLPVTSPDDVTNGIAEANRLQRRAVLMRIKSGSETRFVALQLRRG